eukprot:349846-Chlamydomonas_euryale.AAC.1
MFCARVWTDRRSQCAVHGCGQTHVHNVLCTGVDRPTFTMCCARARKTNTHHIDPPAIPHARLRAGHLPPRRVHTTRKVHTTNSAHSVGLPLHRRRWSFRAEARREGRRRWGRRQPSHKRRCTRGGGLKGGVKRDQLGSWQSVCVGSVDVWVLRIPQPCAALLHSRVVL